MTSAQPLAWVTGAGGLIGHQLVSVAPSSAPGWRVRGLHRSDLDLTDFHRVRREFLAERPRLLIHCAAISRQPECDANPALARLVNVDLTQFLADLCVDSRLVFLSTDLVFDGREGHYREAAVANPLSTYGASKAEAEVRVRRHPQHVIVRTSLNGGSSPTGDRGFNEQLRRAWQAGRAVTLYADEYRSPIAASVTARAVWELALLEVPGTFHVAGSERLSRYEIGQAVAARWPDLKPQLVPGTLKDHRGAPRPPDTSLDCSKASGFLGFPLPGFREWLAGHPDLPF